MGDPQDKTRAASKHELEEGSVFAPRFNDQGLIPAVCTDAVSGDVLMFAWMNQEALQESISTGVACYWSRSRGKLWRKGETSGNTQEIVEMRTDCDQDVVWLSVRQHGGAACHTGRRSCFYRIVSSDTASSNGASLQMMDTVRLFNPKDIYGE